MQIRPGAPGAPGTNPLYSHAPRGLGPYTLHREGTGQGDKTIRRLERHGSRNLLEAPSAPTSPPQPMQLLVAADCRNGHGLYPTCFGAIEVVQDDLPPVAFEPLPGLVCLVPSSPVLVQSPRRSIFCSANTGPRAATNRCGMSSRRTGKPGPAITTATSHRGCPGDGPRSPVCHDAVRGPLCSQSPAGD